MAHPAVAAQWCRWHAHSELHKTAERLLQALDWRSEQPGHKESCGSLFLSYV